MYQKAVKDQRYIKGRQGEGQLAELSAVKKVCRCKYPACRGDAGRFCLALGYIKIIPGLRNLLYMYIRL